MKKTTGNEAYDLIGNLAIALYSQQITISLSSLKLILIEHGYEYSSDSNRGLASSVSAAYHAWEKIDPVIHHAIAYNFVAKDGQPAWINY